MVKPNRSIDVVKKNKNFFNADPTKVYTSSIVVMVKRRTYSGSLSKVGMLTTTNVLNTDVVVDTISNMLYTNCYVNLEGKLFGHNLIEKSPKEGFELNPMTLSIVDLTAYSNSDTLNMDSAIAMNFKNGHRGLLYSLEACYWNALREGTVPKELKSSVTDPSFFFRIVPNYNLIYTAIKKYNNLSSILHIEHLKSVTLVVKDSLVPYFIKHAINILVPKVEIQKLSHFEDTKVDILSVI